MRAAIGIDPGAASPAGVVVIVEERGRPRVLLHRTVRHKLEPGPPLTRRSPMEQAESAVAMGLATAEEVLVACRVLFQTEGLEGHVPVGLELFEDQGATRKQSSGRYLTPYAIGALLERLRIPFSERPGTRYVIRGQVASRVLGPRGYRAMMQGRRTEWVDGWLTLSNDHERSAACHALHALTVRDPLELS